MPLTVNFSATQILGEPSEIVLTDTSTGSDNTITQRRVYIETFNGSYLVESGTTTDYEAWDIAEESIVLDVLTKDYAVSIKVEWLTAANAVVYSKTAKSGFTLYNETFDYGLTQMLAANPLLINDNSFFDNKISLRNYIDSGNQALTYAGDLYATQQCYDKATELRVNSKYYFNANY
jgi:hypothetical protein